MPKLIERHQDYVLSVASLIGGAAPSLLPVQLDTDAPFCLRQLSYSTEGIADTQSLYMRFADETKDWRFNRRLSIGPGFDTNGLIPAAGGGQPQGGSWTPVYPQIIYPADGGVIQVDIQGITVASDYTNFRLYFRGVKLYEEGAIFAPTYPACYKERRFEYPLSVDMTATQTRLNIPLQINNDGDFVFRGGTVTDDLDGADVYANLYARLRDQEGNYFQADWVHVNNLFSRGLPERPALMFPEIYVPRNGQLFMDLMRNDGGGGDTTTQFLFQGAKVFAA